MAHEDKKKERTRMVVEEVPTSPEKDKDLGGEALDEIKENAQEIEELVEEVKPQVQNPQPQIVNPAVHDEYPKVSNSGPSPLVIIIPGILLLGGLLGGIIFYQNSLKNKPSPTATPIATIDVSPVTSPVSSPSPLAQTDLSKFKIKVLNGSGTSGEASKVKDLLTKANFVVSETGNAANYNYTDTIIQAKSSVDSLFLTKLSSTLSGSYSMGKTETLPTTSTDNIIVIVGSTKAK